MGKKYYPVKTSNRQYPVQRGSSALPRGGVPNIFANNRTLRHEVASGRGHCVAVERTAIYRDANGNKITDRDSQVANLDLPNDSDLPDYKGNKSNKSVLSDSEYFYKGQQDDDDFEKLILQEFDLALRKFITAINDVAPEV